MKATWTETRKLRQSESIKAAWANGNMKATWTEIANYVNLKGSRLRGQTEKWEQEIGLTLRDNANPKSSRLRGQAEE